MKIVDLKLASTTEDVESLVVSMLSSDITLFEKISLATYRLRVNTIVKKAEELESDSEDCGSVDDDLNESSDGDSGCDIRDGKSRNLSLVISKNSLQSTEIDESHPGEAWLLGLTEGEYSDLSIEEKLDAMTALVDLLREGSSIRMEVNTLMICIVFIHFLFYKLTLVLFHTGSFNFYILSCFGGKNKEVIIVEAPKPIRRNTRCQRSVCALEVSRDRFFCIDAEVSVGKGEIPRRTSDAICVSGVRS